MAGLDELAGDTKIAGQLTWRPCVVSPRVIVQRELARTTVRLWRESGGMGTA